MSQDNDSSLVRLAACYGIEPGFHDIWGQERAVSPDSLRALLGAMGVPAGSDGEIVDALDKVEAERWRRPLPPVVVAGEADPLAVSIARHGATAGDRLTWTIATEDGDGHEGAAAADELETVEQASFHGTACRRLRLPLPVALPPGYHRLRISAAHDRLDMEIPLIVAPERCHDPRETTGGPTAWGPAIQLYGLRSERNWGIGDFTDLADFAVRAAALGAHTVGLNPIHAMFPADPGHFGPYGPSSRQFLNALYIDPTAVPEFAQSAAAQARLAETAFGQRLDTARAAEFVDYPAASALKLPVFEELFRSFCERHLDPSPDRRGQAFHAFREGGGDDLRKHAIFDALHEHFFLRDSDKWYWRTWPAPFQDHDSIEVARFAEAHRDRIAFFQYLQWIADEQLSTVQQQACRAGMAVGLYRDLAVANHPGGSTAWRHPDVVLSDAHIGAPPDLFHTAGQAWGLAAVSPHGLVEAAYEPFIRDLRANMRHAGALRIDHVMALQRLFWIPAGARASDGAYIRYPFRDLLRLVALESRRNRCAVIGEDLGTVPSGFRSALERADIQSYRVLWFERGDDGELLQPDAYPASALVTPSTHDLPPLQGYWTGHDIHWRQRVGHLADAAAAEQAWTERQRDRLALLSALRRQGLLPEDVDSDDPPPQMPASLIEAVYRFLARTPASLLMAQAEDVLGETEQANLPGTVAEHPNWRRKLTTTVGEFFALPASVHLAAAIRDELRRKPG